MRLQGLTKRSTPLLIGAIVALTSIASHSLTVNAQEAPNTKFSINSFTANYYLDTDKDGVSVLSVQEAVVADYPSIKEGLFGFHRIIPTRYKDSDVNLIVTGVNDISGQPIAYKTRKDADRNLIIDIGNPAIKISGHQTYLIKYQAKGVVDISEANEEFHPNINGRGWEAPFGSLSATIHLSPSIADRLKGGRCFIDQGKCSIANKDEGKGKIITIKAQNSLKAKQSLSAKLDFKKGTFKPLEQNKLTDTLKRVGLVVLAILVLLAVLAAVRTAISRLWRKK